MEGKQIWYITAPASVPISSIQEMSLANIQNGNVVLSHNDNDYGIVQDSSADVRYTKVMVTTGAEDEYRTGNHTQVNCGGWLANILQLRDLLIEY
jgi:hypothetical protein